MSFFNDPSKIDPNGKYSIAQLTDFIRRGQDGHSVREAIAMGMDNIDLDTISSIKEISDFTKDSIKEISDITTDTEERQSDLEERWDNVLMETTDTDPISAPELIEARNGKTNLKTRLDDDYSSVTTQIDQLTAGVTAHLNQLTADNQVVSITHNLGKYPYIQVLYWEYGLGTVPLGEQPEGISWDGTEPKTIPINASYPNSNEVKIDVPIDYAMTNPEIREAEGVYNLLEGVRSISITLH